MRPDNLTIVMASVREREAVREETIKSLGAIPKIFIMDNMPLGVGNCRATQMAALQHAEMAQAPFTLFLEDDLIFSSNFWLALDFCMAANHAIISLYLPNWRFYPAHVRRALQDGGALRGGTYPIISQASFFGSQALLFRKDTVPLILSSWQGVNIPLDCRIRDLGEKIIAYIPNPVQHRGESPVWSKRGKGHSSRSFGYSHEKD